MVIAFENLAVRKKAFNVAAISKWFGLCVMLCAMAASLYAQLPPSAKSQVPAGTQTPPVPIKEVSTVSLFQLELKVANREKLIAPITLPITWTLTSQSPSEVSGRLEMTIDGNALAGATKEGLAMAAHAELSGTVSVGPLGTGQHNIEAHFLIYTPGTHLESKGPTAVVSVPNTELAAQGALPFTVQSKPVEDIACNGDKRLCDRAYDQVSYATTHNSFVNGDDNWNDPAQPHGIRRQLDDGIRALMLDAHEKDGQAYLCHEECWWGLNIPGQLNPTFASGLAQVREFLVANPHEVVTIFVEDYVTPDELEDAFAQGGLLSYVYTFGSEPLPQPGLPNTPHWPTLRQMIEKDRRVVVLIDKPDGQTKYPWQNYEYLYDGQTSYTYVSSKGNISTDCAIERGTSTGMFVMNHFLSSPYDAGYSEINTFDFMYKRVILCQRQRSHIVNFIAVNHYDGSAVLSVVAGQNGLL